MSTRQNKRTWMYAFILFALFSMISQSALIAQSSNKTSAPPLGWNSFDSYGTAINEKYTLENLNAFIEKLKPYGYEYFVLDAGWYTHYDLRPGEEWPSNGDESHIRYDDYGRLLPSKVLFPNGFEEIIEKAHKHGIKFGLHLMRGIPREAVEKNLPIKGTPYFASQIADKNDICVWSKLCYGVNMEKSGAQEYYSSVMDLFAEWGVDFVKYDDISHKPKEINAVINAIEQCERDIVLSISPRSTITPENFEIFKRVDMIRTTRDIWDLSEDIDFMFEAWENTLSYAGKGVWLDLDMVPFGHLRIQYPLSNIREKTTRGYERMDNFSFAQKKTFITMQSLAASPIFMGGALSTSPNIVFELITNKDMLACNQNGITGKLETRVKTYAENVEVWRSPHRDHANQGWIGIFNRNEYAEIIKLDKQQLGLDKAVFYKLYDIWGKKMIEDAESIYFTIAGDDVLFIYYKL